MGVRQSQQRVSSAAMMNGGDLGSDLNFQQVLGTRKVPVLVLLATLDLPVLPVSDVENIHQPGQANKVKFSR